MHLILEYTSDEEAEQALVHELFEVGGHGLENFLCEHTKLKDIHLHREKRALKNLLVSFDVDDKLKEGFTYMSSKQGKHILNRRNRLSDTLCLPEAGREKCAAVKHGIDTDVQLVCWGFYCPGQGNCQRACGGYGRCAEGCDVTQKRNNKHCCSVEVIAEILASDPTRWRVCVKGQHVSPGM
ncbi:uncharacterized protein LOC127847213 [Dreissena polymorpha]|uniref:uncharacterized protein LOC127847213 n=1 Tax=Dreissena polymorpha TaxID=45954 RepID=UPI002263E34F|nr:uncharacterized protein LOC127847213 [Dreissena polymorpha]